MHWIAFGDIHESTGTARFIPELDTAEAVIITGDITNRGSREAAQEVISTLQGMNPRILAQPGNMDTDAVQAFLVELDMDIHLRVRTLAPGLGLMGVGLSTPTPFATPGEVPEATLTQWLDETYAKAADFDQLIIAIHEPPHGSTVDRIGSGDHVGSPGVRAFIERVQPAAVLTGHIHESSGIDHIGSTPVVNPGMLAHGGYVRIDWEGGRLSLELESIR
ncbi:MAG: serine/threonine protein phosphatase [Desulfovibrio sp.]|nr:serine/threonine protein phosphatase [Desulfovibrio sp.]MBC17317.1 serine/threonine protein phosphatase [Desulfovibrio sp.]|tara:strand:+ start:16154 stop:16813 length:660 start_codon:yes stop_codon:yes gene_type:complete